MPKWPKPNHVKASSQPPSPLDGEDVFTSFFDVATTGRALLANEFDLEEEIYLLVNTMRDPDPAIALRAQAQYRSLMKEIANAAGLVSRSETSRLALDPHSGAVLSQTHSTQLLSRLNHLQAPRAPSATAERLPPSLSRPLPEPPDAPAAS